MAREDIETFLEREELHLASIGKRTLAHGIDSILLLVILVFVDLNALSLALESQNENAMLIWTENIVTLYLPLALLYQIVFVTLYGATLGKMVMKIYIIDIRTGGTPKLDAAINRSLVRLVSELVYNLGFVWGIFDPYKQTWHDKTASTLVIDA